MQKNLSPFFYIPSMYFAEGLPYIIINALSAVVYSSLSMKNDVFVFWTSWLYLPWVLKMFWSPLVDGSSTKRKWFLGMQLLLAAVFLCISLTFSLNNFFVFSMAGFFAGAVISATNDIATDGFYMLALDKKEQSFFVGIRTLFYRIAMIYGIGIVSIIAGSVADKTGSVKTGWAFAMGGAALIFAVSWIWHYLVLPIPAEDKPVAQHITQTENFKEAFKTYFTQKNIIAILAFILLYRFGEAFLEKITTPFFIKPVSEGALGMSLQQFGFVKGTLGMLAIIIGNISGGFLLSKYGFKKCIWPFALAITLPSLVYLYMAYFHPSVPVIALLLAVEQFGYGLGFMAFTVFVMLISKGQYKTSHYAISTGIMALGMMLPNMLSGIVQVAVGYKIFYWIVMLVSIPGILVVPFILKTPAIADGQSSNNVQ